MSRVIVYLAVFTGEEDSVALQIKTADDYIGRKQLGRKFAKTPVEECLPSLPFTARPIGNVTLQALETGAHLVIPWLDRAAITCLDFCGLARAVSHARASLHLAKEQAEFSGPVLDALKSLSIADSFQPALVIRPWNARKPKRIRGVVPMGYEDWCRYCDKMLAHLPRIHRDDGWYCERCDHRIRDCRDRRPSLLELTHMRQFFEWRNYGWSIPQIFGHITEDGWTDKYGAPYKFETVRKMYYTARTWIKEGRLAYWGPIQESLIFRELAIVSVGDGGQVDAIEGQLGEIDAQPRADDGMLTIE